LHGDIVYLFMFYLSLIIHLYLILLLIYHF